MRGRRVLLLGGASTLLLALGAAGPAGASEYATADEAKAMANRAAALVAADGIDAATQAFARNPGPFRDRDLYVWIWRRDARVVFHAVTPALIGRNMIDMRDVAGAPMGRMIVAVPSEGWVDYEWPNPQTRAIEHKSSYIVAVGDLLVGVGAYRPN